MKMFRCIAFATFALFLSLPALAQAGQDDILFFGQPADANRTNRLTLIDDGNATAPVDIPQVAEIGHRVVFVAGMVTDGARLALLAQAEPRESG